MCRAVAGLSIDVIAELLETGDEVPEDRSAADAGDVFHRDHLWQCPGDEPEHLVDQRPGRFLRRVDTTPVRGKRLAGGATGQDMDVCVCRPHRCEIGCLDVADVLLMERRSNVGAERVRAGCVYVDPGSDVDASLAQAVREATHAAKEIDSRDYQGASGHDGTVVDLLLRRVTGHSVRIRQSGGRQEAQPVGSRTCDGDAAGETCTERRS